MPRPQMVGAAGSSREDNGADSEELSEIVAEGPTVRAGGEDNGAAGAGAGPAREATAGSNSTASRQSASQRAQQGDPEQTLTRESLQEQGIHGTQADAILVRVHEEEVLMANFRLWIQCFSLIVCLLTPAMLGIMIWMMVEYVKYRGSDCDVPLQMWCMVVASIVIFNATLNRPTRNGSLVVRLFCLWEPDPQVPRRPPLRVRLYNAAVALFIFGWNLFGLYLVVFSGSADSSNPPCEKAAPGLYTSVKVYVVVNLTFTVFFYVNMVGFSRVLGIMLRRGMLHSNRAAPKGTLEARTETVRPDDEVLKEQTTCSICLDDYDATSQTLRIKVCGHVFHKQCLQGWMNVNRNCPICRRDLVDLAERP